MSKLICTCGRSHTRLLRLENILWLEHTMKQYQKSNKRNIFFALRRLRLSIFFLFFSFFKFKEFSKQKNKNNIYVIGHSCVQQRTNYHDHEGLYFPSFSFHANLSYTRTRACVLTYTLRSEIIRPRQRQLTHQPPNHVRDSYPQCWFTCTTQCRRANERNIRMRM